MWFYNFVTLTLIDICYPLHMLLIMVTLKVTKTPLAFTILVSWESNIAYVERTRICPRYKTAFIVLSDCNATRGYIVSYPEPPKNCLIKRFVHVHGNKPCSKHSTFDENCSIARASYDNLIKFATGLFRRSKCNVDILRRLYFEFDPQFRLKQRGRYFDVSKPVGQIGCAG